jgi:hypothetical protein
VRFYLFHHWTSERRSRRNSASELLGILARAVVVLTKSAKKLQGNQFMAHNITKQDGLDQKTIPNNIFNVHMC